MFFGIFLVLAGVLGLAEASGLVGAEVRWGMPLAVICFGGSVFWDAYKARKTA
ncbi:hypothetical protein SAMN05421553_2945 [Pseudomonas anguilliseptica]|uniref:Uncharacterized protein n=1 Tax=Pseudomonas anguilliseptica TaxID=53406 RepID=A0A1H5BY36_PSEAG|nr:hypothetical protein SAMN05421553_2945 [Pseudomonas anguilliseptica]